MKALDHTPTARPFHRSEAFPEDVADFVKPSLSVSVKAVPMQRRQRTQTMLWLLGLLPLMALAVGVTRAF